MKILKFEHNGFAAFGVLENETSVRALDGSPFEGPIRPGGQVLPLAAVRLLVPTVEHPRIFGVGFNYKSHIIETGRELPEIPPLFMKPDTSLTAHCDSIIYPAIGQTVHYEAELVAVIGRQARNISRDRALEHVLGYTCGNDVSERIYQRKEMAMGLMTIGKAFDTFAPIGPWIATCVDPANLRMQGRLNGKVVQDCSTSDLLFDVARLIEYISAAITLKPGDLIMTGTPAGIGNLAPGDTFEVEIEGIGVLSNTVVAQEPAP